MHVATGDARKDKDEHAIDSERATAVQCTTVAGFVLSTGAAIDAPRGAADHSLWIAVAGVAAAFAVGLYLAGWLDADDAAASRAAFASVGIKGYLLIWCSEALFAGLLWRRIARGRDAAASDGARAGSAFVLLLWIFLHLLVVMAGGGFLAHMDRPWNQLGTEMISPAHLMTFISVMPSYLVVGGSAYLYARVHIPEFANANRRLMLVVFGGPFMFVPAFDPQFLLHTLDPGGIASLTAYWIVTIGWAAGVGWLLTRVGLYAMQKMPR
jgi:hypothetical protein